MQTFDKPMADKRNQTTVTLSPKANEEYELVAAWLGMPVATLMRQILENHHQSPSFANLVRRAMAGEAPPPPSTKFPQ